MLKQRRDSACLLGLLPGIADSDKDSDKESQYEYMLKEAETKNDGLVPDPVFTPCSDWCLAYAWDGTREGEMKRGPFFPLKMRHWSIRATLQVRSRGLRAEDLEKL